MKAPLGELFKELAAVKLEQTTASSSVDKVQEPAPEKPPKPSPVKAAEKPSPASSPIKRKLPGLGVSIRGKSNPLVEEQAEEALDTSIENEENRPLDILEVEAKWRTFARALENFAQQTLLSAIPKVEGDSIIKVELQNNFQKKTIEEVQQTLMPYLRKQLHNKDIMLELEVSAALESTRAFTPHERLKEMIKDHPDLNLLIERFNLEIE